MSFKRDGDNIHLLKNLKHKRVADLIGDHIPDDEAKLLSNGRLTCLVCHHRPIFDNMKILSIHRRGKRHIYELSRYLDQKYKMELDKSKMLQMENIKSDKFEGSLGGAVSLFESGKKIHLSISGSTLPSSPGPSSASKVRRYLKEISRKTPMSKLVYEKKESYPEISEPEQCKEDDVSISDSASNDKLNYETPPVHLNNEKDVLKNDELFSLHLSGWIRDKFGNLVKDPNAEFDSDDD